MIWRKVFLLFFVLFFISGIIFAADIRVGNIRLVLNERTGNYLLYYLTNGRYEALFNREQTTSFTSIYVDGNIFRLGNRPFRTRFENQSGNPSVIFEVSNLRVTKVFTFIKTVSSHAVNGVMITYNIQNISNSNIFMGLRVLIDTELGEGRGLTPFFTNNREITNETLIGITANDMYWISRGRRASLMGSIINPIDNTAKKPDFIHFANWKRLFDAPWMLNYLEGHTFNNDSAVCYFFEPTILETGRTISYSIILSAEDTSWYNML
ncbi:MAG: hypothetical protein FWD24_01525 [Treponema sp.]|nr:hypothetical protein [Treponema sp.]